MSASDTIQFAVRDSEKNEQAVVLVHGFHGDSHLTFGMLPAFLAGTPECYGWDIHCFGYPTTLAPDISGVWSADPDLTMLSLYLTTSIKVRFGRYKRIAVIALCMGGLIVQRALLDGGFDSKISHILFFGTPSDGLRKAGLGRIFKRQARDMTAGGDFIRNLRSDWKQRFGSPLPFAFRTVAGLRDEFVPRNSSLDPFPQEFQATVAGNHLEMVKPQTVENDTMLLVLRALMPGSAAADKLESQTSAYQRTIDELLPQRATLDEKPLVKLALALEMTGRQSEAIELLRSRYEGSTEIAGVLASRLKRLWLSDPETYASDGEEAEKLYRSAFQQAARAGDRAQALYNGINTAFMTLALHRNEDDARAIATQVLQHCKLVPPEKNKEKDKMWRIAT
jgi:pimeloyl-ACP methyl ester carboxylesterase